MATPDEYAMALLTQEATRLAAKLASAGYPALPKVYFAQAGPGGPIKMGCTTQDPKKRLRQIRARHDWSEPYRRQSLQLLNVYPGYEVEESALARLLVDDRLPFEEECLLPHWEWYLPTRRMCLLSGGIP